MASFVGVSQQQLAGKGWRRPSGYGFAATENAVALVGSEFARAALAMPIAFIEQAGQYVPAAVLSPIQGRNLFVGPAGQWLGGYVPAMLRTYPFRLARAPGSERASLCIDDASVLIPEANAGPEDFFAADGTLAPSLNAIVELLRRIEQDRPATDLAVAALVEARLIQAWPLTVTIGQEQVQVGGLHCVNEAALNALDDDKFLKLRKAGALVLADTQLLSMGQAGIFSQLAVIQQQLAQPHLAPPAAGEGMIRFN